MLRRGAALVEERFTVPVRLYRIGDLVRYTPLSRQTIHNYTVIGLIQEADWTKGGHRLYDESVFSRLKRITEMKKTNTLSEIKRILTDENQNPIRVSN